VHLGFCVLGQSVKDRCCASTIVFASIIKGLCEAKQVANATEVFAKTPLMGCPPDLIAYNTLVGGLCSIGETRLGLEMAMAHIRCKSHIITYNTLIHVFCDQGEMAMAVMMFQEMVAEEVRPDAVTCSTIIGGFCKNILLTYGSSIVSSEINQILCTG
jgi:pentatricopeptide repeat protein